MSGPQDPGLVGSVLGGSYRITRLIGQGGMGAVYEGVQTRLERRVAVKLMARELSSNPEAIARFRREAEVTSQIGHPHIVQVFDFGQAPGGEPYIVMEYLEGEDLEKRIQRVGQLPLAAASQIVRQVSSALSATHAKGIVHRDLKPANVFLLSVEGETDFVKVVDFGISKVRSASTKLTAALAVMGTPNYMAPEQAAGRVNDIDARTDQWALACIAYELVAGRPPFVGEDVASLLYQVIHQAPDPLAAFNPGLPGAVDGVLRRALSKTQADRFPTLTEFSRAFEGAASGRAVPATAVAPARAPTAVAAGPAGASATTFSGAAGEAGGRAKRARRSGCGRSGTGGSPAWAPPRRSVSGRTRWFRAARPRPRLRAPPPARGPPCRPRPRRAPPPCRPRRRALHPARARRRTPPMAARPASRPPRRPRRPRSVARPGRPGRRRPARRSPPNHPRPPATNSPRRRPPRRPRGRRASPAGAARVAAARPGRRGRPAARVAAPPASSPPPGQPKQKRRFFRDLKRKIFE